MKGGTLGYEDEKFAYLVVSRDADEGRAEARILRHPRVEKGRIVLALCTPAGAQGGVGRYVAHRPRTWNDLTPLARGRDDALEAHVGDHVPVVLHVVRVVEREHTEPGRRAREELDFFHDVGGRELGHGAIAEGD